MGAGWRKGGPAACPSLSQQVPDFGEELFLGGAGWRSRGLGRRLFGGLQGAHFVHRFDKEEEQDGSGDEETDDGIDDHADVEDPQLEGDIRVAADGSEDGFDEAVGDSFYNLAEGAADQDADGEVDGVAFDDEIAEFGDHAHNT